MRKMIVGLMVLMLVIGCQQAVQEVDVEAEKAAIMKVMESSLAAWDNRNWEAFSEHFVQKLYMRYAWASKNGAWENKNWESFETNWKKGFETDPEPKKNVHLLENPRWKVWKNVALVTFNYSTQQDIDENPNYRPARWHIVFEKTVDGWKVVSSVYLNRNSWRGRVVE
ncbi:hypothetical protein BVY01_00905 [bacterium I07]|nr:hypothetical protein BVY01_00905 [bacterium I07]